MKKRIPFFVAATVILLMGLLLALPTINDFPAFTHSWSQSDWYAISIGFLNNGFDFFHPETLIYNKQYPGWWAVDYGDTVTSVDFPIHNYIVALMMSLLGTTAPWVFRLWTLLCSLAGAWFLYQIAWRLTRSTLKSLAAVLVYMTAPVYSYYFASYLPSAPALALLAAGMWAYVRHWQGDGVRWWHWATTLLGLATLVRSSQAVALVAVCSFELLRVVRREVNWKREVIPVAVTFAAIVAYHFWNKHLAAIHGTIFLSELRTPESWVEVHDLLNNIKDYWQWQYFTRLQHWVIALTLLAAAVVVFRHRAPRTVRCSPLALGWLSVVYFLGEVCFFIAMMVQYKDHDYYFLDSFFMPCILLFVLSLKVLPDLRGHLAEGIGIVVLVLLGGKMTADAMDNNRSRCDKEDRAYQCSLNYEGADRWLDSLGVSRDATILSVFSYPQNAPFIQMGRKGYSLMWFDKEIVDAAQEFPFDYAVVEDKAFRVSFVPHKRFLGRLQRLAGNGRISLCRMEDTIVNDCADDFFLSPKYVGIRNGRFWLDGKEWFPMMINYKAFIDGEQVIPAPWYTGGSVREHFDTIASWGFNAVRVCLDVMEEGGDTAAMYRATRRMVQQADSAGLRVMLLVHPLFDEYWTAYTAGLMRRLADLPALWAYDLLNEPLYFDPVKERDKQEAVRIVEQWRLLVRRNAPHQLFTVATAEPLEVMSWDPSLLPVDFVEMHTYHPLRVQAEMWWYSRYCHKPWMVGEIGLPADGDSVSYTAQAQFMGDTYTYARRHGAAGYGWWEFQDYPAGVNFEAQFTGLRDNTGRRKLAADMPNYLRGMCLGVGVDEDALPPGNYYNMLVYTDLTVDGTVTDQWGNPIEGAVVRGWNDDWSVGVNTFTDSLGHFCLVTNDSCTHFALSAPHHTCLRFDRHGLYPNNIPLCHPTREYQQIPLLGWGDTMATQPSNLSIISILPSKRSNLPPVKPLYQTHLDTLVLEWRPYRICCNR